MLKQPSWFWAIKKSLSSNYTTVVLSCIIFIIIAGSQSAFGVFFKPMSQEFGWNRASTSGPFSVFLIVNGVLTIIMGRLNDRIATWKFVSIGAVLAGLSFVLMSTIHNIWELYLYYGVVLGASWSTMFIPLVSNVTKLFTKRRGLMSGITVAGIGAGFGIIPPIVSQLIAIFNWRLAALYFGIFMMASIIILGQLLRMTPKPESGKKPLSNNQEQGSHRSFYYSLSEAIRTSQFWFISITYTLFGFYFYVILVHIVPYGSDRGLSAVTAATVLTAIGLGSAVSRIGLGYISDRISIRKTIILSCAVSSLSFFLLAFVHAVWVLYVFAIIYGLFSGLATFSISINAEYFGVKELGAISGIGLFGNAVGSAAGPVLAGVIYDRMGNYQIIFLLCAIAGVSSVTLMWLLKPTRINYQLANNKLQQKNSIQVAEDSDS